MANKSVPAICVDLPVVSRFCRSVALAVASQQHTRLEWVEHRDSSVINALYSVMFWMTPPGVAEVKQSSRDKIEQTTDELHQRYLSAWIRKLHERGPLAANGYINDLAKVRDHARDALSSLFQDASQINRMVAGELKSAIINLARIKLGGSVGVAVLGAAGAIVLAPAGALICSGVSLGYSTTTTLAKTWEQGGAAKAVGIEFGKAGAGEALGRAAEAGQLRALAGQARAENIIRSCEGEIRKYSQRLAQEGLRKAQIAKAQNIVGRATAQKAGQQQAAISAGRWAKVGGAAKVGVPLVFAAMDIWGAWTDYDETVQSL